MTVTIDTTQVIAALNHLQQNLTNMTPVFHDIGQKLQSNIQQNLGAGLDAWGNPFAPLKKPRRNGSSFGDVPLNDTRQHIYNKITFNADNTGVDVGMLENVPIGTTHQFGSSEKNIPARPFLPIIGNNVDLPNDWNTEIMNLFIHHFGDV